MVGTQSCGGRSWVSLIWRPADPADRSGVLRQCDIDAKRGSVECAAPKSVCARYLSNSEVRMAIDVGRIGIWLRSYNRSEAELVRAARELDRLGYGAVWLGGANGSLRPAEAMLAATERIVVATGIVSVWSIPAAELVANRARVTAAYGGRFLLGLGASHEPMVGAAYRRPYSALVSYLDEL